MAQVSRLPVPIRQAPRARALLEAVIAISTDLDLHSVLTRIVASATELTSATYGALGVIGGDGELLEVITTGIEPHDRRAGHSPGHLPIGTVLSVPVRIRGTVFGNLYLAEKAGGLPFTSEDEALVLSLARAAGFMIDNARSYGLSERRRQWLESSAELADALQPPINLPEALRRIAAGARLASGAIGACVVQLPDSDDPVITALDGMTAEEIEPALVGMSAAATGKDGPVHLRTDGYVALILPLRAHLTDSGVLAVLFDDVQHSPAFEDRELLEAFADQAGLALDRALAVDDQEKLAVVTERDHIARELHDVVIQRLFATGLQLESVIASAPTREAAEQVDHAVTEIDETIKQIRSTIFGLRTQP